MSEQSLEKDDVKAGQSPAHVDAGDAGYSKSLKSRHVNMIAIGGAIGTGLFLITDNGGIFPNGLLPMLLIIQGVVFAYASVELVGVAAGETENPEKIMPKAIK